MPTLRPIASEPIAIRQALEEGWRGFRRSAPALIGFTLLLGGANLLSWLVYRQSGGLLNRGWLQGSGLELVKALGSLITYLFTGLWLLAGLVRGAEQSLEGGQVRLVNLLRGDARAVTRLAWSGLVLLLLLALVPLGMFLDGVSILLITVPLTYPVVKQLGFDGVWYAILVVKMIELGLITPPVGVNAFVVANCVKDTSLARVFRAISAFIVLDLIIFLILFAYPPLVTWLPSHVS